MKKKYSALIAIALTLVLCICGCFGNEADNKKEYEVTVLACENGNVSLSASGKLPAGSRIVITPVPDRGYVVDSVTVNGTEVEASADGVFVIESLDGNSQIGATFKEKEYRYKVNVSGDGEAFFGERKDGSVQFSVQPYDHNRISFVTLDGKSVDIDEKQALSGYEGFADAFADHELGVVFEKIKYSINVNDPLGVVTADKKEAVFGDTVTLSVNMPDDGKLISLKLNGTEIKDEIVDGKYVFRVDGDVEVIAEIDCRTFSVKVNADAGVASYDLSSPVAYSGGSVTLNVKAAKGYRLTSLTVNGKPRIFDGVTFVLDNITEDVTIAVFSEKIRYTVSVESQGGGTVTASREYFYYGDDVTLYVQPATGYVLSKLTVCGEEVTATDKYVISGKAENVKVAAEFEKEVYSVVLAHGEGGNVYSDKKNYSVGDSVTVTFEPDRGYKTKFVSINGTLYDNPGDSFVISEYATGDVTVYAGFEIVTYTLKLERSGNGKAEASAAKFTVKDTVNVKLYPDEGFRASVTINGVPAQTDSDTLVFSDTAENLTVSVSFTRIVYTVTASCGDGGKITVIPATSVQHGGDVTVLLSADSGYHVEKVTVNGTTAYLEENKLIVKNVKENLVIDAVFAQDRYSVIIGSCKGGKIVADKTDFTLGEKVTFEFIADEGYKLDGVTVGGMFMISLVTDGKLVVNGGDENMIVEATFVYASAKTYSCTSDLNEKYGEVVFSSESVTEGGTAAFMVKPSVGYAVTKVTASGTVLTANDGIYTLFDVRSDVTVHVEITLVVYKITVEKSNEAEIFAPSEYTVEDEVEIKVTDAPGYRAESVTVGDKTLMLKGGKAVYSGAGDVTVSATCVYAEYEITLTSAKGCTLTADGNIGGIGKTVTVRAVAETGYKITAIVVNGAEFPFTGGEYKLSDVTENTTVSVKTGLVYYTITVKNYYSGQETVSYGEVRADKTSYSIEDEVVFTVLEKSGYYLKSFTVNGTNRTDSIENGKFVYTGKFNVIAVANFAENGLTVKGTVRDMNGGAVIAGANVSIIGAETVQLTSDSSGRFSAIVPNGSYTIKCSAEGYDYDGTATVSGSNREVNVTVNVADSIFEKDGAVSGGEFSYDFEKSAENVTIDGTTPTMAFSGADGTDFVFEFTVENRNDASTNYETEPGIGIIVKAGSNTFTCQFVAKRTRIIINNDWSKVVYGQNKTYYDFNKIGEKHALAFVKNGNTVMFLAKGENGEYEQVFVYSDERLGASASYSMYVTKLNSSKTLKMSFTEMKTATSLKAAPATLKGGITVDECSGGELFAESFDDGYVYGKNYRVYAVPDKGMQLSSVKVGGETVDFVSDGAGGGYVYVTPGANTRVSVSFATRGESGMTYSDGTGYGDGDYDKTLFYRNDLITDGADPGVMYVSEEEDPENGGWFYMTVTSHCTYNKTWSGDGVYYRNGAFMCYRSKDLATWEIIGAIDGYALGVKPDEWAYDCYWAPEMMRDKQTGKYFLYFSARSKKGNGDNYSSSEATAINSSGQWDRLYLGIAMADKPMGPYRLVSALDYNAARGIENKATNADGVVIDGNVVPINFAKNIPAVVKKGYDFWPAIDVSPFTDDNGDFYLYFSQHVSSVSTGNAIWVMKMKDLITPDYTTMRLVSLPGYTDVTSEGKGDSIYINSGTVNYASVYGFTRYSYDGNVYGGGVNEGVNVIKDPDSKKYFLTYSPFGYGSRRYSIMQAVSDSPFGPFTKLAAGIANPVLGIYNKNDSVDYNMSTDLSASVDYIAGTGHHCFVRAGDELFAVYHAFYNPVNNYNASGSFMGRRIAADRVFFVYNETVGHNVLYGNGPTDTLQAMPSSTSGYGNVISSADITATNAASDTLKYLSDGLFVMHNAYEQREFSANGESVIEITFPSARKIRAVMLYSAARYKYALKKVGEIKLITSSGKEISLKDVQLNSDYYNASKKTMHYGGAIIADFDAVNVTKIVITVSKADKLDRSDETLKISDIVVLGEIDKTKSSDYAAYASSGGEPATDGVRVDGKPFDKAWENACSYVYSAGGIDFEVKAVRGEKGVYFLATAYVDAVYHSDNSGNTYKQNGLRRFYKNTGWRLNLYVGKTPYSSADAVSITADAYNFVISGGKKANVAMCVNGTVNGYTESFSIEAYVPYKNGVERDNPLVAAVVKYYKVASVTSVSGSTISVGQSNGGIITFGV